MVDEVARWYAAKEEAYRAAGAVAARADVPPDASAQDRLIAAFGRDPGGVARLAGSDRGVIRL